MHMNRLRSLLLRKKALSKSLLPKPQTQMLQQRTLFFSQAQNVNQKQRLLTIKPRKSGHRVIKRNINNEKLHDVFQEDPDKKTLSEMYRADRYLDRDNYIKKEQYNALSESDRYSLNRILFTYTGCYALDEKYITVDEFLLIPYEAREYLSDFFYNAEEERWEALYCREKIDRMFRNNHFNIKMFISLSNDKRKILMEFLDLDRILGMVAVERGYFTINEFLSLNIEQQESLLNTFREHLRRTCGSYYYGIHNELFDNINKKVAEFKKINDEEKLRKLSAIDVDLGPQYDSERGLYYYLGPKKNTQKTADSEKSNVQEQNRSFEHENNPTVQSEDMVVFDLRKKPLC